MDQLELLRVIHLWLQNLPTVQYNYEFNQYKSQSDRIYNQKLVDECDNCQGSYSDMIMCSCHLQVSTQNLVSLLRICPQTANERNRLCV